LSQVFHGFIAVAKLKRVFRQRELELLSVFHGFIAVAKLKLTGEWWK